MDKELVKEKLLSISRNLGIDLENDEDKTVDSEYYEKSKPPVQPLNRIFFGAPGTGKSFGLNKDAQKLILCKDDVENLSPDDKETVAEHLERVTFYPDYTYSQFVGSYKPVSKTLKLDDDNNDEQSAEEQNKQNSTLKNVISYEFVPGPFIRIITEALKHMDSSYVLIIEEINRAKAAAVFGDVFQLLDRNGKGASEYSIQISNELGQYFKDNGLDVGKNLRLPNNLYIWATMNSADQGVFPIDAAFKRRWSFEYVGINNEETKADKYFITIRKGSETKRVMWNALRGAINNVLSKNPFNVHEDKLLGPFFLKQNEVDDSYNKDKEKYNSFENFKNKVLMYLFEDVIKMKRDKFFHVEQYNRFSAVCDDFDKKGLEIFVDKEIQDVWNSAIAIVDTKDIQLSDAQNSEN